jgi:hypothetical protein
MITGRFEEVAAAASGEILLLVAPVAANPEAEAVTNNERTIGKRK